MNHNLRELPDVSHILSTDAGAALWPDVLQAVDDNTPQLRDRHFVLLILVLQQVVDKVAYSMHKCTQCEMLSS